MKKVKMKKIIMCIMGIMVMTTLITGCESKESVRYNSISESDATEQTAKQKDVVMNNDKDDSKHITTAVQQIMIGTKCNNYDDALQTLLDIKEAGYEAIELNHHLRCCNINNFGSRFTSL